MLENILFAFLALILLIPLLYFLPLGFKKQGKLIIVGISLLLALFGLLANTVFNLWQTSLLLLTFALAATYLVEKRLSTFIFADKGSSLAEEDMKLSIDQEDASFEKEKEKIENAEEVAEDEKINAPIETLTFNDSVGDLEVNIIKTDSNNISKLDSDSIELQTGINEGIIEQVSDKEIDEWIDVTQFDDLKDNALVHNEETTEAIEEVEEETNESDDSSIVDYNIDEIINEAETNKLENNFEHTVNEPQEGIQFDTLEELDYMEEDLLTEDEIQVVEEELDEEEAEVLEEELVEEDEVLEEQLVEEESKVVDEELVEEETEVLKDVQLVEEETELVEEELAEDEAEVLEDNQIVEEETELVEERHLFGEEAIDSAVNSDDDEELTMNEEEDPEAVIAEESVKTKQVKQQMIHTMVAQLQHSRKYLSSREYENQVKAHLHPSLPSSDYYTFAYLLIEHYISEHNEKELTSLITHLKEKFTNYAIIQQQLQFLEEYYCKK